MKSIELNKYGIRLIYSIYVEGVPGRDFHRHWYAIHPAFKNYPEPRVTLERAHDGMFTMYTDIPHTVGSAAALRDGLDTQIEFEELHAEWPEAT